jgi:aspartate/methionine/tyrosine aminotransferase
MIRGLIRSHIAERLPAIRNQTEGFTRFLHYYSDAVIFGPGQQMMELENVYQTAVRGAAGGNEFIDLFLGDPSFGRFTPEEVAALGPLNGVYPPTFGLEELRERAAHAMAVDGLAYKPSEVVITAGASQAIIAAVQCFTNPDDKVVLFDPAYLFYYYALDMQRVRIAWVPTALSEGGIEVDWSVLDRALRGARMLFINSPCNPTGGIFAPDTLQRIVDLAARRDVIIFSDEVYNRYVFQGEFRATAACPGAFDRTITVRSLSKEFGLASLRVGWMAAPAGLMRPLTMHHAVSSIYVPTISQRLAMRVLDAPDRDARHVLPEYLQRRQLVAEGLKSLGLDATPPQGAFYFWFRIPAPFKDSTAFATRLMEEERVLLMPGTCFGPSGESFVRLSLTSSTENLREALKRLGSFIQRNRD